MSRIGKNPVPIPEGVKLRFDDAVLHVEGQKGKTTLPVSPLVAIDIEAQAASVRPLAFDKRSRAMWGTMRSRLQNAVQGVHQGFTKKLEISGVGYRAQVKGKILQLSLGLSHEVAFAIPEGLSISAEGDRQVTLLISGVDKRQVGQVASEIKRLRRPDPYKGKGIKYQGEILLRKEGKKK